MMQIISKGFLGLSIFLVGIGTVIGRLVGSFLHPFLDVIANYEVGFYLIFFGIGIPCAILHVYEERMVWRRIFKFKQLDLLGVSVGFAIGVITCY